MTHDVARCRLRVTRPVLFVCRSSAPRVLRGSIFMTVQVKKESKRNHRYNDMQDSAITMWHVVAPQNTHDCRISMVAAWRSPTCVNIHRSPRGFAVSITVLPQHCTLVYPPPDGSFCSVATRTSPKNHFCHAIKEGGCYPQSPFLLNCGKMSGSGRELPQRYESCCDFHRHFREHSV